MASGWDNILSKITKLLSSRNLKVSYQCYDYSRVYNFKFYLNRNMEIIQGLEEKLKATKTQIQYLLIMKKL